MSSHLYTGHSRYGAQYTTHQQQQAYYQAPPQQRRQDQYQSSSYCSSSSATPDYYNHSTSSSSSSSSGSSPPHSAYSHSPPQHYSQPTSPYQPLAQRPSPSSSRSSKTPAKEPHPYLCLYANHSPPLADQVSFKRKADLKRHYANVHNADVVKVLECTFPGCERDKGRKFGRVDKLREHLREVHGVGRG